jgi:ribosomal protein S18 acetylase RimI-like enzyme
VRNEKELHEQIADLPTDFPALFSDEVFARARFWVAVTGDDIIGSVGFLDDVDESEGGVVELNSFSVSAAYRGMGVGSSLLKISLKSEFERGVLTVKLLTLGVLMENAIRLYISCGFQIVSESMGNNYELKRMRLKRENATKWLLEGM